MEQHILSLCTHKGKGSPIFVGRVLGNTVDPALSSQPAGASMHEPSGYHHLPPGHSDTRAWS